MEVLSAKAFLKQQQINKKKKIPLLPGKNIFLCVFQKVVCINSCERRKTGKSKVPLIVTVLINMVHMQKSSG